MNAINIFITILPIFSALIITSIVIYLLALQYESIYIICLFIRAYGGIILAIILYFILFISLSRQDVMMTHTHILGLGDQEMAEKYLLQRMYTNKNEIYNPILLDNIRLSEKRYLNRCLKVIVSSPLGEDSIKQLFGTYIEFMLQTSMISVQDAINVVAITEELKSHNLRPDIFFRVGYDMVGYYCLHGHDGGIAPDVFTVRLNHGSHYWEARDANFDTKRIRFGSEFFQYYCQVLAKNPSMRVDKLILSGDPPLFVGDGDKGEISHKFYLAIRQYMESYEQGNYIKLRLGKTRGMK